VTGKAEVALLFFLTLGAFVLDTMHSLEALLALTLIGALCLSHAQVGTVSLSYLRD
jgi:hypothetical protein